MRKGYLIPFTLSVLVLLFASDSIAQTAIQKQEGDDQDGIVSTVKAMPDVNGTTPGPGSPTGSGKPPRVGTNRQVNDVQKPFPDGFLGRSETSIAASTDGQFIVAGWNDAQGFCTPVFGGGCDPGNQNGLSGFGFSSDGGQTYTDGGAPPVVNHIFTRGDPWLERGGFDKSTFFYANLAVHDTTGDSLGVSVHRGHFVNGVLNWEDVQAFNAPHAPNDFYDKEATVESGGNVDVAYQEGQETPVATNPFCTIRVATLTGNIALRRRGSANSLVDTFWVQSTNGGATFSTPTRVSSATSNWCTAVSNIRPNFGDYIGSVSGGNSLIPVWHDGRNGVPDVFVAPILGAGKSQ